MVVGRYNKNESEGFDVKTMDLPAGQDELIAAVEKANPHTVVVLNTGDPVTMTKWLDTTPALLDMWYGGQEGGNALAAIFFGDANPSGQASRFTSEKIRRLARPQKLTPARTSIPITPKGIYVGYRYYDTKNVEPQFPFGFGLSYTKFEYSDLKDPQDQIRWKNCSHGRVTVIDAQHRSACRRRSCRNCMCTTATRRSIGPTHELKGFSRVELNRANPRQ